MRIWMLIIIAVVLGVGLGFNLTILELGASPAGTVKHDLIVAGVANPEITGPQPRIAFDKKEYNFGTMELNERLAHTFEVRNDGQLPLKLNSGGVTCGRCTEFTIGKEEFSARRNRYRRGSLACDQWRPVSPKRHGRYQRSGPP